MSSLSIKLRKNDEGPAEYVERHGLARWAGLLPGSGR